jgi:UDPglucose 6-dehydrogenase
VGADVQQVARGIGLDGRIGGKFLNAGPGYGGSCFPKDTIALVRTARDAGAPVELVETTVKVNDERKRAMARKVVKAVDGDLKGKTVGILGLTFKPNTDDMRDAPSLAIIPALQDRGATVKAFDPEGMDEARRLLDRVDFKDDPYAVAEGADALVLVTEWDQFRALDLDRIKLIMNRPVLIDLRNIYKPADIRARGFQYASIGRP